MATAPWRCSQCGTINEPVANSCRACGKWPSLFDLEDSVVDEDVAFEPEPGLEAYAEPAPEQAAQDAPEPVTVEVEAYEPPEPVTAPGETPKRGRFEPPPTDPVGDGEGSTPRWVSWLIPLAVVAYFVISTILNNR